MSSHNGNVWAGFVPYNAIDTSTPTHTDLRVGWAWCRLWWHRKSRSRSALQRSFHSQSPSNDACLVCRTGPAPGDRKRQTEFAYRALKCYPKWYVEGLVQLSQKKQQQQHICIYIVISCNADNHVSSFHFLARKQFQWKPLTMRSVKYPTTGSNWSNCEFCCEHHKQISIRLHCIEVAAENWGEVTLSTQTPPQHI